MRKVVIGTAGAVALLLAGILPWDAEASSHCCIMGNGSYFCWRVGSPCPCPPYGSLLQTVW
jgi:hypothetical protein